MIVYIKYQPNLPLVVSLMTFYAPNHSLVDKWNSKFQQFLNLTEQLAETSTVFPLCGSQSFLAVVGKIVIVGAMIFHPFFARNLVFEGLHDCIQKIPTNPPLSVSLTAFYESNHSAKLINEITKFQ